MGVSGSSNPSSPPMKSPCSTNNIVRRNSSPSMSPATSGRAATASDPTATPQLWVESTSEGTLEIFAGLDRGRANLKIDQLMSEDLNPRTAQSMKGADGGLRICGIWGRLPADDVSAQASQDLFEANFHLLTESRKDRVVGDVSVCEAGRVGTVSERALAALEGIDKTLTFEPDDLEARLTRANWNVRLGANQNALNDLRIAIGKDPQSLTARQEWVVPLARNGLKQDALAELKKMQGASIPEHTKLYAAAVVAAVLGDNPAKALESLEATIRQRPQDLDLKYDSVRALALVSKALSAHDPPEGRKLAARAIQRSEKSSNSLTPIWRRIDNDAALDSLRDDPAFLDMMRAGNSDRRYAAVWTRDSGYESGVKLGFRPRRPSCSMPVK